MTAPDDDREGSTVNAYTDKERLFGHKAGVHDDQKPNRKRDRREAKAQLRKEWKR